MRVQLTRAGALAALVLSTLGCSASNNSDEPVLPSGRAIGTGRSITPTTHLFADRVTARLDVILDRRLLDPERVDVKTVFEPYEQVGEAKLERGDSGPYSRLRYEFTLRCQTTACLPETIDTQLDEGVRDERRTFRLPPADVLYDDPTGDLPPVLRSVSWPALTSVSRISVAEVESDFPFRSTPAALPAPTPRVPPWLLVGVLVVAALGSLAWPLIFGVRTWKARRPTPVVEAEPVLSPLEQALLLVEKAAAGPEDEARRSALEHLAVELEQEDAASLAEHASVLAWSRSAPSSEVALTLVERIRDSNELFTRA
jgi:hypothetical protein